MHVINTSPQSKNLSLGRYRHIMMLFVTGVTACYLWIEYGMHTFVTSAVDFESIHWIFAGIIWLLGLSQDQHGICPAHG